MTCINCGRTYKGVVCIACRAARQRSGILLHQTRFLETWRLGQIDLRVRRKNGVAHLELFDDRWHTYCDIDLFDVPPQREYRRDLPADLCAGCRETFDKLMEGVPK